MIVMCGNVTLHTVKKDNFNNFAQSTSKYKWSGIILAVGITIFILDNQ